MRIPPYFTPGVLAVLMCATLPAQASSFGTQEELIAKREKKKESRFLRNADWIVDYDEARAEAKKQGKLIFTYFSRSYSP